MELKLHLYVRVSLIIMVFALSHKYIQNKSCIYKKQLLISCGPTHKFVCVNLFGDIKPLLIKHHRACLKVPERLFLTQTFEIQV